MSKLNIRMENQLNPVAEEVSALTAVVRPIIEGILFSLKRDIVNKAGGYEKLTLDMMARLYRPGDGDCGLCFEYAIHDALNRREPYVLERVETALTRHCKVSGNVTSSILFGVEKNGAIKLIDTAKATLTDESSLLYGVPGRPAKLKPYIEYLASAFRSPRARLALPSSISGLWKADLFIGHTDSDKWVATTVKINPKDIVGAKGLRIGIVPSKQGKSDKVYKDTDKNLVICPVPHDQAFMEIFYQGWQIAQQFIAADARVPREVALPRPASRQVARYLEERRTFPVLDVLEVLLPLCQPELLETIKRDVTIIDATSGVSVTGGIMAPVPRIIE